MAAIFLRGYPAIVAQRPHAPTLARGAGTGATMPGVAFARWDPLRDLLGERVDAGHVHGIRVDVQRGARGADPVVPLLLGEGEVGHRSS